MGANGSLKPNKFNNVKLHSQLAQVEQQLRQHKASEESPEEGGLGEPETQETCMVLITIQYLIVQKVSFKILIIFS